MNSSTSKIESFISVIIALNSEDTLNTQKVLELYDLIEANFYDFEIIFITHSDKFSQDIKRLTNNIIGIRHISLRAEVSKNLMVAAGLENSIGDIILNLSLLEDTLKLVIESCKVIENQKKTVVGRAKNKNSNIYEFLSKIFKYFTKFLLKYHLEDGITSFFAIRRNDLNQLLYNRKHLSQICYNIVRDRKEIIYINYSFESPPKQKKLINGFREALNLLVLDSTKLLRFFNATGLLGAIFALFASLYVFIINLFKSNIAPGWTTTMLFISVQFCILFLVLFILGEYMARLINERWENKEYEVANEVTSSVMLNTDRWNVTNEHLKKYPDSRENNDHVEELQ